MNKGEHFFTKCLPLGRLFFTLRRLPHRMEYAARVGEAGSPCEGGVCVLETVGAVAVLLLAVYGCMEGIRKLVARLVYPPCGEKGVWVLWFRGRAEDAEFTVRCAAAESRGRIPICLVEAEPDDATHAVLERVCRSVRGVELFTPTTFSERFF